jgi:hypothetical protein
VRAQFIVPGLVYYLLHKHRRRALIGRLALLMIVVGVVMIPTSLAAAFLPLPPTTTAVNASAVSM